MNVTKVFQTDDDAEDGVGKPCQGREAYVSCNRKSESFP